MNSIHVLCRWRIKLSMFSLQFPTHNTTEELDVHARAILAKGETLCHLIFFMDNHTTAPVRPIMCLPHSLQSLVQDWNGGMEWWNGIVECVLQGDRSLLMQFSMKVTVGVSLVPRPSSLCPQKKIRERKAWYNLSRD